MSMAKLGYLVLIPLIVVLGTGSLTKGLQQYLVKVKIPEQMSLEAAPAVRNTTDDALRNTQHEHAPILILHVGPHKTGTTTIQDAFRSYSAELKSDNYTFMNSNTTRKGVRSFYGKRSTFFFDSLRDLVNKNPTNMIVSEEDMSFMRRGGDFFRLLKKEFPEWHIHVVVGYRRYHEWLVSLYNQRHKNKRHRQSFVDWYRTNKRMYAHDCFRTYHGMKQHFDSVSIVNIHSPVNLMTNVFCNVIPHATHSCTRSKIEKETGKANPSIPLWPKAVSEEARFQRLTFENVETLANDITEFASTINYAVPLKCLLPQVQQSILDKSLQYEKDLVPDFFQSPLGEGILRQEFEAAVQAKKFCSVDVAQVLEDERWQSFFQKRQNG